MEKSNRHIDPIELLPKYLAKEANPDEVIVVENWIVLSNENKKEFNAFAQLWNASGPVAGLENINLDFEWKKLEKAITPAQTKTIPLVRYLQVAASIILISTLAFLGIKYASVKSEKSPVAELKTIKLPDGSVVLMNADSKITYSKSFGIKNRNIALTGEAYFEVTKNKDLPFVISANDASIEVVGTRFNVKAYNKGDVKVLVTEGKVKFYQTSRPENKTLITAGESGSYIRNLNSIQKSDTSNLNDIAWKTMIVDFKNTSLLEAVKILENTYHVDIEIEPNIQNCSITVHFEKQDLPSVLKVLKSTLDLTISSEDSHIKISGTGC